MALVPPGAPMVSSAALRANNQGVVLFMSITVVGSIALDTVETPSGRHEDGLGGAAVYFSLAAANYTSVNLVGVVGTDFPDEHVELLSRKDIDLTGLQKVEGKTFRWSGRYHDDVNLRDTLDTQLNVFENFHPKLPDHAKDAKFLFLGNIHPSLQLEVLEQASADFIALDTMNLWIESTPDELKKVLKRIDCLVINDSEAKELTGEWTLLKCAHAIRKLGPEIIVIKKGEHGCLMFLDDRIFSAPGLPMPEVIDPTGAGDSFAGGFLGYLDDRDLVDFDTLRKGVIHGSVVASFTCEEFGPKRLANITAHDIAQRYITFMELASI